VDVYVIPIGRDRYELYCETSTALFDPEEAPDTFAGRWRQRVSTMLRTAEERRQQGPSTSKPTFAARTQDRAMAWVAERIAEQRLLWNLRRETSVGIAHPQDMTPMQVLELVRRQLRADRDRHRRWMVIDGVLFLVTFVALGPLFLLIPGIANLPALYFGFRALGHWLSMHGATRGLDRVAWVPRACAPLDELREASELAPAVREARVHDVASRLRLPHLTAFFERVVVVAK
jgi:hypothetical protein